MRRDEREVDYLVATQLEENPRAFVQVVKEAFLLELDCVRNQDIAAVLGVDKSRITQIFANPTALKAETVQSLVSHLKSTVYRQRIIQAWVEECFGDDVVGTKRGSLTGKIISEKTLRRIDRHIRESRLLSAASTALEALKKTDDVILREQLLDRAFFARNRLDEPGQAMAIARMVKEGAESRGDLHRLGAAYKFRVRILASMPDAKPDEVETALQEVEDVLVLAGPLPSQVPPYVLATKEGLSMMRLNVHLTFAERGVTEPDFVYLQKELVTILRRLKRPSPYQQRFRDNQLAARIYLLLGKTFQAQEHLERSFESGEYKNLQAVEMSSLIQGRIMALLESPQVASDYMHRVSKSAMRTLDFYHRRLAEYDLVKVESERFGGSE